MNCRVSHEKIHSSSQKVADALAAVESELSALKAMKDLDKETINELTRKLRSHRSAVVSARPHSFVPSNILKI